MAREITSDELIETLVSTIHGQSDLRVQHYFRQQLQLLVGIAKLEQRDETAMELPGEEHYVYRGTMH